MPGTIGNKNAVGNKGGRPAKIEPFVLAMRKMFEEKKNEIFIYTDEELVMFINEKLTDDEKIGYRTFQDWKAKVTTDGKQIKKSPEWFVEFLRLLKKALAVEKANLIKKLGFDDKAWQRWAWILERKFSEWNIKHKHEIEGGEKPVVVNITGMKIT